MGRNERRLLNDSKCVCRVMYQLIIVMIEKVSSHSMFISVSKISGWYYL